MAYENSFAYTATPIDCHACREREHKAWVDQQSRDSGQEPIFGRYYSVTLDD